MWKILKHCDKDTTNVVGKFNSDCKIFNFVNTVTSFSAKQHFLTSNQCYLDIAFPCVRDVVMLDILLHDTFFCNITQYGNRLKCECFANVAAHEIMICCEVTPVLNLHLSRNSNPQNPTISTLSIPSFSYFDKFIAVSSNSLYSLVSVIYQHGASINEGHHDI